MATLDYSVIIPAYNASEHIRETLDAILAQQPPALEVIVVDDGSTDDTADIVASYTDPVRCIRVNNGGQGLARRIGIDQSNGEWIALCDSDDVWNADHIARRAYLLDTFPDADLTFSDCYSFGPNSDPEHSLLDEAPEGWMARWTSDRQENFFRIDDPYAATLEFNPMYVCGLLFRRSSYDQMGGFKEKYSRWMAEDSEFIRRFMALPGVKVAGDSQQTWGYRRHAHNYSALQWRNIQARARILQEHMDEGVVPPYCMDQAGQAILQARREAFDIACWERDHRAAVALFRELPAEAVTLKRRLHYFSSRLRTRSAD